jgi:predicted nucleotide-binding protein
MARKPPPQPAVAPKLRLTVDEKRAGIARLAKRLEEVKAFDVQGMTQYRPPELDALAASISQALERTFGENTADTKRFMEAADLFWRPVLVAAGRPHPVSVAQGAMKMKLARSQALLEMAIQGLHEEIGEQEQLAPPSDVPEIARRNHSKVFVVHGHDEAAKLAVARFLGQLGLEAIILSEQPDQGLTIIEKFERDADQVGFAVVLLTPDDIAGSASAPAQAARARQNVIFELGYFAGKLGRGRACLLRKGEVEIPSDLYGVIYTEMDAADGWKLKLVKEMKAAKLEFDANKVWG